MYSKKKLLGWRPLLVGWRPLIVGWRPSLLGWRLEAIAVSNSKVHHDLFCSSRSAQFAPENRLQKGVDEVRTQVLGFGLNFISYPAQNLGPSPLNRNNDHIHLLSMTPASINSFPVELITFKYMFFPSEGLRLPSVSCVVMGICLVACWMVKTLTTNLWMVLRTSFELLLASYLYNYTDLI